MGLLDGKIAVITGAGGGIGREEALLMAKEGAKVIVNDLGSSRDGLGAGSKMMADKVVEEIKSLGGEAAPDYNSVATPEGAEGIIKTAVEKFGGIDILVNNAGILRDRTLLKMTDDEWDLVMKVHLYGTFYCGRAAARVMKEQGRGGKIINTTSIAGLQGNFGQTNYGAAKAGIAGITRVWGIELIKYGISCNAIAPIALTRLTEDLPAFQDPSLKEKLNPKYIAPLVLFLASDLSKGITGKIFSIQGTQIGTWITKQTKGITKESGEWTAQEISEKIKDIMKE